MALARRKRINAAGEQLWLAPAEYVIIRKLEFHREGGSEKHLRDIRGILVVTEVDRSFVEAEAAARGLEELWSSCVSAV